MILTNLYDDVLLTPIQSRNSELFAVSGYASATFANKHLNDNSDFNLNLIIGMPGKRSDHLGFIRLYDIYGSRFNGYYLNTNPPVHCKTYAWFEDEQPLLGFAGSANYSQTGFTSTLQQNQISHEDPQVIKNLYDLLLPNCVSIPDYEFDGVSSIVSPKAKSTFEGSITPGGLIWEIPDVRVRISFLALNGTLPARSGLNWGQRPEQNREPNQAYLSLRKDARQEGFLPPLGETFTLLTDDSNSFDCVVAQQGRKAIHSTLNNSEIGLYIRQRIGVEPGEFIDISDLENYGRTDYTIEKINDETFLLDLSLR